MQKQRETAMRFENIYIIFGPHDNVTLLPLKTQDTLITFSFIAHADDTDTHQPLRCYTLHPNENITDLVTGCCPVFYSSWLFFIGVSCPAWQQLQLQRKTAFLMWLINNCHDAISSAVHSTITTAETSEALSHSHWPVSGLDIQKKASQL